MWRLIDEEGHKVELAPELQQRIDQDPVFRELFELFVQMEDERQQRFVEGMQRIAALPDEMQRELTQEQLLQVFHGETRHLLN